MTGKKTETTKSPVNMQIIEALQSRGPMRVKDLTKIIPFSYQTINTTLYRLGKMGLVKKGSDGTCSLQSEHPPASTRVGGTEPPAPGAYHAEASREPESGISSQAEVLGLPLPFSIPSDQRGKFMQRMVDLGVRPVGVIPTLTDIFLSGDIYDLQRLADMMREFREYFAPRQRRLMLTWWATSRGIVTYEQLRRGYKFPDVL